MSEVWLTCCYSCCWCEYRHRVFTRNGGLRAVEETVMFGCNNKKSSINFRWATQQTKQYVRQMKFINKERLKLGGFLLRITIVTVICVLHNMISCVMTGRCMESVLSVGLSHWAHRGRCAWLAGISWIHGSVVGERRQNLLAEAEVWQIVIICN